MHPPQLGQAFTALGAEAHVIVVGQASETFAHLEPILARVVRRVDELERRWTRFCETSELSRLNAAHDKPTRVSIETLALVAAMQEGWNLSGGRFDATVLDALEAWGYDRPFDEMSQTGPPTRAGSPSLPSEHGLAGVEINWQTSSARLPAGIRIDPGGIGKGLAADLVCAEAIAAGAAGCCVNLGGDIRMLGRAPEGRGWSVTVQDPRDPENSIAVLRIGEGAVASSARTARRWEASDGRTVHHLIDPATGAPVDNGLIGVIVIAGEAWRAEVLTKTAFVAGANRGRTLLEAAGVAGFLVDEETGVHAVGDVASFTR